MGSEKYHATELDEIKVGDHIVSTIGHDVKVVVETDVLGEMAVPSDDEGVTYTYTAGVRTRKPGSETDFHVSYRRLVESRALVVERDWKDLTERQRAALG